MKTLKILFIVIVLIHGLIHLPGFIKAFKLANIEQLHAEISKTAGVFWLIATLMFIVASVFFLVKNEAWMYLMVAAILLSTVLIIFAWKDAKYGMIPNVIILAVAALSLSSYSMNTMISKERTEILAETTASDPKIIVENDIAHLPAPVKKWLVRSGVIGKPEIKSVRIDQTARMKMKQGQEKWYTAKAEQYVTTGKPAFIWTVNMNMSPVMNIKGRDKFVDGKGAMLIRMNSLINIVNEKGEKLDEGTIQRYLGEMVWYPTMALSPYITWESIDASTARATISYMGTTGSGVFHFNEKGDFVKFVALRYKGNEAGAKRYEWVITVNDYAEFEGIKVPSKMEATWRFDEGDWTWLKLDVEKMKYNLETGTIENHFFSSPIPFISYKVEF